MALTLKELKPKPMVMVLMQKDISQKLILSTIMLKVIKLYLMDTFHIQKAIIQLQHVALSMYLVNLI